MKTTIVVLSIIFLCFANSFGQEIHKNEREQLIKEDRYNQYKANQISDLDIALAFEILGLRINKFYFGEFDKKYNFYLLVNEYVDNKIVKTDTLLKTNNLYHYYKEGNLLYDYIDQIKIFTKEEEGKLELYLQTYKMRTQKEINYQKNDKDQFYNLRNYTDTKWVLDQKVPMLVYASSWEDKQHGLHRFCGVVNLSVNDKDTEELFSRSPHYFVISYKVTEIED